MKEIIISLDCPISLEKFWTVSDNKFCWRFLQIRARVLVKGQSSKSFDLPVKHLKQFLVEKL